MKELTERDKRIIAELENNFYSVEWDEDDKVWACMALDGGGCNENVCFETLDEVTAFYHGVVQGRRMLPSTGT